MKGWDSLWKNIKLPWKLNLNNYYDWVIYKDLEPYLKDWTGSTFLEAGCAPGRFMEFFNRYGFKVFGIDYSEKGIKATKTNLELLDVEDYEVVLGDVNAMPFKDSTFDIVFSAGLIEHFRDPMPVLSEFSRVTKKGGLVITYVPNLGYPNIRRLERLLRGKIDEWHNPFKLNDLVDLCHSVGLKVVEARFSGLCVVKGYSLVPKVKLTNKLVNWFTASNIFVVSRKS